MSQTPVSPLPVTSSYCPSRSGSSGGPSVSRTPKTSTTARGA
ncbi:hypothetical protein ACFFQF_05710 [Haladaptatus pallidirubidus]